MTKSRSCHWQEAMRDPTGPNNVVAVVVVVVVVVEEERTD